MAHSTQYQEKLDLFKSCIHMEEHSRVPNLSNFFTWKVLDSEYKLSEALNNFDIMEKVVCNFHERYQFDAYMDLGTRNQPGVSAAFGKNYYTIDDETGAINFVDAVLMNGDEYPEFVKNPQAFYWKMFLRKFPNARKGQVVKAIAEMAKFGQYNTKITEKFVKEYNCPGVMNMSAVPMIPFENFFSYYRGIKEASVDLRRRKGELKEALDTVFTTDTLPTMERIFQMDTSSFVCDVYAAMIAHSVMNRKQFEEFYWPYFKKIIDLCVENNKTIYIYCESAMARFAEYFQDIPKGHVVMHIELDDPFELRKKLPNICIAGGMKTELLGKGTTQECVDYAKRLVDEMGPGFIFSQDKMISFKFDCQRENLLAVNEFLRSYKP